MALGWLVHSVCTALYPKYDVNEFTKNEHGSTRMMKYTNGMKCTNEGETCKATCPTEFQMPLHYPRYKKVDYETMEEWRVDLLLKEYGIALECTLMRKGLSLWVPSYGLTKFDHQTLYSVYDNPFIADRMISCNEGSMPAIGID